MVLTKPDNFANAREVRNIFEKAVQRQSSRLYNNKEHTQEDLTVLKAEDVFPKTDEEKTEETAETTENAETTETAEVTENTETTEADETTE